MNKKLSNKIRSRIRKAIRDYSMFDQSNRILVASSGGKDSMILTYYLLELGYKPDLLFIDLGIPEFSEKSLIPIQEFSEKHGLSLYVESALKNVRFTIHEIADDYNDSICSVCGSVKRKIFNRFASQYKYDVLLTGHNMDDEVRFLFSNNKKWNWAYLKKSVPVLEAKNGFTKRAKPLAYVRETETLQAIQTLSIPHAQIKCPFVKSGNQDKYHNILTVSEREFPGFINEYYFNFLKNYKPLSQYDDQPILQPCKLCGDMTSSEICKVCRVHKRNWRKNKIN